MIDESLRDLLEDAAHHATEVAPAWVVVAHPQWTGEQVAALWLEFSEAVITRDRVINPPRGEWLQSVAQRADDAFVSLLRGPAFPTLHAVAA